jgi:polyisoprenoid-binding protein YceI
MEPAVAAPQQLILSPANTLAQTHSHAVVLAFAGTYRQLTGSLVFDPGLRSCTIDVTFNVASLTAPSAMLRGKMMAKNFLDPHDYPLTHYHGACRGNRLIGNLTLRGQTHAFDMDVAYVGNPDRPTAIHAAGSIDRYQWGIYGLRLLASREIRVTDDISLNGQPPAALSAR